MSNWFRMNNTRSRPKRSLKSSIESTLLESDVAFVRMAYRLLLRREPDPEGGQLWISSIRTGDKSRSAVLRGISKSKEAKSQEIPRTTLRLRTLGPERALLEEDDAFVMALYLLVLGREPDEVGRAAVLSALHTDQDRRSVFYSLVHSDEGRMHAAHRSGADVDQAWMSPFMSSVSTPSRRSVAGHSLPSCLLLISSVGNQADYVKSFLAGWAKSGQNVRVVFWNQVSRSFELISRADWESLGLPTDILQTADVALSTELTRDVIDDCSVLHGDWLISLEPVRSELDDLSMIDLAIILEAKKLKLRTAFAFHGASSLRSHAASVRECAVEEEYLQSLLLADALVPVSAMAERELIEYLTQHLAADFIPQVRKILQPTVGDEDSDWPSYTRAFRGFLREVADDARLIGSLYYLTSDAYSKSRENAFVNDLARALTEAGIGLIPVRIEARALVSDAAKVSHSEGLAWRPWRAPADADAPNWLLVPGFGGSPDAVAIGATIDAARESGLRAALIVDAEPTENRDEAWAAVARFDKVFVSSEDILRHFKLFLLRQRLKVVDAEHRFKAMRLPTENLRRVRHSNLAIDTKRKIVFGVPAAQSSPKIVKANLALLAERLPTAEFRCPELGEGGVDNCDIVLIADSNPVAQDAMLRQALWSGKPCLVHANDDEGLLLNRAGVLFADLGKASSLASAVELLSDPNFRRALAYEAGDEPAITWSSYAGMLVREIANDRKTDLQHAPDQSGQRDVYETLFRLEKRPKLSLCISTYNRASWLELNLKNIFMQLGDATQDVEVVVVDNTSPDATPEVVQQFLHRKDFRYYRNPANVGMLGNLAITAQRSRGEYVWIIGDDDFTRPGVIWRVLDIIDDHPEIRLIYLNYGYTTEQNAASVLDLDRFLNVFSILEPSGPDRVATVKDLAALNENFYTAIYSHVYKRDHALRSYCQDTSGRTFSTIESCIPTSVYTLGSMADAPAYWVGEPAVVMNSNVSWVDYAPLFELEQFPRAWDLAERMGTSAVEVDRRRNARLPHTRQMWCALFDKDPIGNSRYVDAARILTRLHHLENIEDYIGDFYSAYRTAYRNHHPAAQLHPEELFKGFLTGSSEKNRDAG